MSNYPLSEHLASYIIWNQLWMKSPFYENNYLDASSLDWISNWLFGSIQWITGWNYMAHLCESAGKDDTISEIKPINLADRLVNVWILSEFSEIDDSFDFLPEFYGHLANHFGIDQQIQLNGLETTVFLYHGLKNGISKCQKLARQETVWNEKQINGMAQLMIKAHQTVYQAAKQLDTFELIDEFNPKHKAGLNWAFLGFQGVNPATDFRSMGMLAVRHLHKICMGDPHIVAKMALESCRDNICWYSFGLVSISMTKLSLELLQSGLWMGYFSEFLFTNSKVNILRNLINYRNVLEIKSAPESNRQQINNKAAYNIAEETTSANINGLLSEDRTSRNRKQFNIKKWNKNDEMIDLHEIEQEVINALDSLHFALIKKFHQLWLESVDTKQVTSVMDTEKLLGKFRYLMANQLWQQCSGWEPEQFVEPGLDARNN